MLKEVFGGTGFTARMLEKKFMESLSWKDGTASGDYRQLSDLQRNSGKGGRKRPDWIQYRSCERNPFWVWSSLETGNQQKQEAKKAEIEAVQKTIWNHQENGKRFQEHAGRF